MSKQTKPATTFQQQVDILAKRGLIIEDVEIALETLKNINYYRLRGYYIHLCDNDVFQCETSFNQLRDLYAFDTELKTILLQLLFDIEIAYRTRMAYVLGHEWGPLGYMSPNHYNVPTALKPKLNELLESIGHNIDRSKELFIKAHITESGKAICPIWVAVETMSFGDLSKIYSLLPPNIKKKIAAFTPEINHIAVEPRIHNAVVLRNLCAHNCRVYNRAMALRIRFSTQEEELLQRYFPTFFVNKNSLFAVLLATRSIASSSSWNAFLANLTLLFSKYKGKFDLQRIGFPLGWVNMLGNKL